MNNPTTDAADDPTRTYFPGLEGVIAGESAICQVHADAVLLYRGYDVHDLAGRVPFEAVAYLLLHGELPSDAELARFAGDVRDAMRLPGPVVDVLRRLPRDMHPMDQLRTGLSAAAGWQTGVHDNGHAANLRKATRLAGLTTAVVAAVHRVRGGLDPLDPDPNLGVAGNFLHLAFGGPPDDWQARTLDAIYTLYAEHDFNAGTFTARVVASTLADLDSAVVAAIGALKGPLHGGANEQAMQVLRDVGSPEHAESWLQDKFAKKEKVMGFGHRVYKKGDSRVPLLRDMAREAGRRTGRTDWVEIGEQLEKVMMREKGLPANADLYAAPLFHMLSIPADLNTPLFAASRVVGWCAHVIEQHDNNRLIRPRSRYTGPARRAVPDRRS